MNVPPAERTHTAALAESQPLRSVSFAAQDDVYPVPPMSPYERSSEKARIVKVVTDAKAEVAAMGGVRRACELMNVPLAERRVP